MDAISLIKAGKVHDFYCSSEWQHLRAEVLEDDKHECQECKRRGKYSRANHVHHINYVRKCPDLALSKTYVDADGTVKRNLISTCKTCHETVCHPERLRREKRVEPLTVERW